MTQNDAILVLGASGLIGSGVARLLAAEGFLRVLCPARGELDLRDAAAVEAYFARHQPAHVFLLAGRAGGIEANRARPAEFIHDNLAIQSAVMRAAWRQGASLLWPASACAYPKDCPQPMRPEMLLTGPLEPTSESFAVAKLAGIKLAQAFNAQHGTRFIVVVPATVYGPGDRFDEGGHVVASLIARFHRAAAEGAPRAVIWGTGRPRREFLYVDDVAQAMIFLMRRYKGEAIMHIGAGQDVSIMELATLVAEVVGFRGRIEPDPSRPDGMPRRLLESSLIRHLGWQPSVPLREGLARTYEWYRRNAE